MFNDYCMALDKRQQYLEKFFTLKIFSKYGSFEKQLLHSKPLTRSKRLCYNFRIFKV